jgi:hypothetical protein
LRGVPDECGRDGKPTLVRSENRKKDEDTRVDDFLDFHPEQNTAHTITIQSQCFDQQ